MAVLAALACTTFSVPSQGSGLTTTMLCMVNNLRQTEGLPALGYNSDLESVARSHSNDMASMDTLSHTGSDGTSPAQRIGSCGYDGNASAENVAYGSSDLNQIFNMWKASPGHLANMMDPTMTHFGFGYSTGSDGNVYYTQDFGGDGQTHDFDACPRGNGDGVSHGAQNVWSKQGGKQYYN